MIKPLDLHAPGVVEAILRVQLASYRVEAELIRYNAIPRLYDTEDDLRTCGELFLGFYEGDELVGALSYRRKRDLLDIHRLMVHPDHFRKGIATSLLKKLEESEAAIREIVVCTGADNAPAIRLYQRCGFKKVRDVTLPDGLVLCELRKELRS